nr:tyrosine hydroxylase [Ischnura senegalensis]
MMAVAAQKNREMFAIKKSYSIENGYPARRRSLVDDARFETLVVKQTKQSVLEEARQRCNDSSAESYQIPNDEEHAVCQSNDDVFHGEVEVGTPQGSAGEAAAAENDAIEYAIDDLPLAEGQQNESDEGMTEEEAFLAKVIQEGSEAERDQVQWAALVLRLRDGINSLARILKTIENLKGTATHVESRPSKTEGVQYDVLVRVQMPRSCLLNLLRSLRQSSSLAGVSLLADPTPAPAAGATLTVKDPWFPKHASDLDNCNHLMTKYEPELDMNHPGFADKVYRERRREIAAIAFAYKYGQPIPRIDYTETETATWTGVFRQVLDLMPKHACSQFRDVFALLMKEGIFREDRIPQLEDMSAFLKKHTGFTLRPAAGLLTARDFLASLAFRVFQSTQYVRHTSSPYHTPEPDCIHELLGHMPLLADPSFAQFSQEIGLASLGASDAEIEKLSTVYWFTVEFGLCKEGGDVKAYGAGLLSSYGELLHALSDKPEHRSFEPASTAVQPYQDQEYQPVYYVADSFEDAKEKFRRWVSTCMSRPFEVRFNPHTERVEILDSVDSLESLISQMNLEMLHLNNALKKLKFGC